MNCDKEDARQMHSLMQHLRLIIRVFLKLEIQAKHNFQDLHRIDKPPKDGNSLTFLKYNKLTMQPLQKKKIFFVKKDELSVSLYCRHDDQAFVRW
jgi:hypothetical protein